MIVGKPMANPLDGFYCPECGFNVAADEDGLCQRCGLDTSTGESVREHCAAVGLHLVTAADKAVLESENAQFKRATGFGSFGDEPLVCTAAERAVLDAMAAVDQPTLEFTAQFTGTMRALGGACKAELARREAKP
jgi:hypothetical protein